jgi:hypothetical protein
VVAVVVLGLNRWLPWSRVYRLPHPLADDEDVFEASTASLLGSELMAMMDLHSEEMLRLEKALSAH